MLKDGNEVDLLFQNVPQPWHPQSAVMHEVSFAVKAVDESKFYAAVFEIFKAQEEFFDSNTAEKSRSQLYEELVAVVAPTGAVGRGGGSSCSASSPLLFTCCPCGVVGRRTRRP